MSTVGENPFRCLIHSLEAAYIPRLVTPSSIFKADDSITPTPLPPLPSSNLPLIPIPLLPPSSTFKDLVINL